MMLSEQDTPERLERLRAREAELVRQLRQLQSDYITQAQPLAMELRTLREHRDGRSYTLPDGQMCTFKGPRTPYRLPDEVKEL